MADTDNIPTQSLVGALTFASVPEWLQRSESWFTQAKTLRIDLDKVSNTDSAGLALLIEWLRRAQAVGATVKFVNLPRQLQTLIRVSGLQHILFDGQAT